MCWLRRLALALAFLLGASSAWAARIFTNGIETNNLSATSGTEWSTTSAGTPTVVTTPVHSGTYALEVNPSAATEWQRMTQTADTAGTYWTRFYVRFSSLPAATTRIYTNASTTTGTNNHYLEVNSSGNFILTNVPTSGTITSTTQAVAGTWYAIGIHHVISDTAGALDLQINCNAEGTPITTGDTLNTNVGRWFVGVEASGTITAYYDDFVVNDETGSAPFNTWSACPANLYMLEAASDNTVVWTKTGANCSGTTNTDCVDDEPGLPDETSGYVRVTTTGQVDRLNTTTFSGGPDADDDIITIFVNARVGGAGTTGTNNGNLDLWDQTGSKTAGPTAPMFDVSGWKDPADPTCTGCGYRLTFDAGTRVKADIEAFDWGYETSGTINASTGANVTALWVMVEWAAAAPPTCTAGLNLTLLGVGGCP